MYIFRKSSSVAGLLTTVFGTTQGKAVTLNVSCWDICWSLPTSGLIPEECLLYIAFSGQKSFIGSDIYFYFVICLISYSNINFTSQYVFQIHFISYFINHVPSLECRSPLFSAFLGFIGLNYHFHFFSNVLPFLLRSELCVLKHVHSPTFQIYMLSLILLVRFV